jgi:hypothetical protein
MNPLMQVSSSNSLISFAMTVFPQGWLRQNHNWQQELWFRDDMRTYTGMWTHAPTHGHEPDARGRDGGTREELAAGERTSPMLDMKRREFIALGGSGGLLAAMNKCLAPSNKSRTRGKATQERERLKCSVGTTPAMIAVLLLHVTL